MFRVLALSLLLAGCASAYAPPPFVNAVYQCGGGATVPITFNNRANEAVIVMEDGTLARLIQQPSASGIWYAAEGYELRGKGREATITLAGLPPLSCTASER